MDDVKDEFETIRKIWGLFEYLDHESRFRALSWLQQKAMDERRKDEMQNSLQQKSGLPMGEFIPTPHGRIY